MRADEIPAAAIARAGENIESRFEPIVKAVRDLDRLVPGMMSRQRTVGGPLSSPGGEVVVQLDHRHTARDRFRAIDLDLIVVLGARESGAQTDGDKGEN